MTCRDFGNNVDTSDSSCFTCPEGTFVGTNECVDCGGARRCVSEPKHLLCVDNELLASSKCTLSTQDDTLFVTNNHAVKCTETHFADGASCGQCPVLCASCNNGSSCSVCAAGSSQSPDGACATIDNAIAQTHNGALACDEPFFVADTGCVPCGDLFGAGCKVCSAHECLSCSPNNVLENGVCRQGDTCQTSDGTACTSCVDGTVSFNATDCVPAGGCALFEVGKCVHCVEPSVLQADGTCAESETCVIRSDGLCLRCADGTFADENGICRRLAHPTPHPQRVTRRCVRHAQRMLRSARHATRIPVSS